MPLRRFALLVLTFALCAAATASPAAAKTSKNLWATVNVCDTQAHPNQLGIRARMPGDGRRGRMYMRFYAQYVDPDDNKWHNVTSGGHSGWVYVGSSLFRYQEAGWTFPFDEIDQGAGYTMRGRVRFEWRDRKGRKVRKRAHVLTTAGHASKGADPPGYSEATCFLMG